MAAPADLAIRPLGPGEIIDRAVALTRRHFRPLFLAMLLVQAPALALARLQSSHATALLGAVGDPAAAAALLAAAAPGLGALLVALLLLQLVATATATAIVAPSLDPRPVAPPLPTGARVRAIATAAGVHLALLLAAPAAGALPGVLLVARARSAATLGLGLGAALAGALVLFLVALLRLVLAPAAAAVEGTGGLAAARRSSRLMAPRRGAPFSERPDLRASVVLLGAFLLALAVNGLAGLPRAVAARLAGAGPAAFLGGGLPLPVEVLVSIFEALAGAALQPFGLVAVAVLYFDRRARAEALDVAIWADALEREEQRA